MQLQVDSRAFKKALQLLAPVARPKGGSVVPMLSEQDKVAITATQDKLVLAGMSSALRMRVYVPLSDLSLAEGESLPMWLECPVRGLSAAATASTGSATLSFDGTVSTLSRDYSQPLMWEYGTEKSTTMTIHAALADVSDWPNWDIPAKASMPAVGMFPSDLETILRTHQPFVSKHEGRRVLTGSFFQLTGDQLHVIGTDGSAAAWCTVTANVKWPEDAEDQKWTGLLPIEHAAGLRRLLRAADTMTLFLSERPGQYITVATNVGEMRISLMAGNYPDLAQVVHQRPYEEAATVSRLDLQAAAKLCGTMTQRHLRNTRKGGGGAHSVTLHTRPRTEVEIAEFQLFHRSEEGDVYTAIDAEVQDDPIECGFSTYYLQQIAKVALGERITISTNSRQAGGILRFSMPEKPQPVGITIYVMPRVFDMTGLPWQ